MEFKLTDDGVITLATEADHIKAELDGIVQRMIEIKALHIYEHQGIEDARGFLFNNQIITAEVTEQAVSSVMELMVEELESTETLLSALSLTIEDVEQIVNIHQNRIKYTKEDTHSATDKHTH